MDGTNRPKHSFEQTDWSQVRKVGNPALPLADAARERFCQSYWYPVHCYICSRGHSPECAQDLTQEFFARVLEKNYLKGADREKGKFRTYLLTILKRFLADEWDRASSQKRGGFASKIPIDADGVDAGLREELAHDMTPDRIFERTWAISLLQQARSRLEEKWKAQGKEAQFRELLPLISGEGEESYASVAAKLQMSESNVKTTVHRLRRGCRELLRDEISKTALTSEEVDEEINYLFRALQ